jgi:hypothetical protein
MASAGGRGGRKGEAGNESDDGNNAQSFHDASLVISLDISSTPAERERFRL